MISIYNTMTKQKELFKPIHPGKIGIYVCGMTVYDYCHIGHGRVLVTFDVLTRYLRYAGFDVTYVRNITDIDDKIIQRANDNKEPFDALTTKFINALKEDEAALGVLPPDHEPKATEYIPQMIQMIERLVQNKFAYVAENGDVYYRVNHFHDYGHLAHQDLEKLRAGARVDVTDVKKDPLDFVLWKLAKPGEPSWDSPWGKGRPGWHIECSAMSTDILGKHFDIHGGGLDLVFPHHQNEIAQSEGANKEKFVDTWIHVGFVQVDEEKMSKSLGNFFTIRDVLKKYRPEVIRYFITASHHSSPINYSEENLLSAEAALIRFYTCLRGLPNAQPKNGEAYEERFKAAMNDDFNTPQAIAVLFDLVREINRLRDQNELQQAAELGAVLRKLGGVLGILQQDSELFLQQGESAEFVQQIEEMIAARNAARKNKEWQKADEIRQELLAQGVVLEDGAQGTTWRRG